MEKTLSVIRWILHKLAILLLGFTVWSLVPFIAFSVNATDSAQVKSWLSESNTYQHLLDESAAIADSKENEALNDQGDSKNIDSKALLQAITPAIPPEFLQTQTEQVIDGFYAWLQGDTVQPEFSFSLKEQADEIGLALIPEIKRQISAMPTCATPAEVMAQQGKDPLDADCLPPGFPINEEAQRYATEFVNKADGPIQSEFTGDDLDLSSEALLNAPTAFETLELMPTFFWAFLFAFGAIAILTARRWQRGFKEVGLMLIVSGGFLFIVSFVASRLANAPGKFLAGKSEGDAMQSEALRNIIEPLAKVVTADIASSLMMFSGIVLLLGVISFATGWQLGKTKNDKPKAPEGDVTATQNSDGVPELMRDDNDHNFIDKVHQEKTAPKPKIRDKIKKKLIQ